MVTRVANNLAITWCGNERVDTLGTLIFVDFLPLNFPTFFLYCKTM